MTKSEARQRRLNAIQRRARKRAGAQCATGKVRFRDHDEAVQALWNAHVLRQIEGNTERQERRAYECRRCNGWHLTSQPNKSALVDPVSVYRAAA